MVEFESMESMAKRLAGTGGGAQAKAVIAAINAIRKAEGTLDADNRMTAIYHLAVALAGNNHAESTIENTAQMLRGGAESYL